MHTHQIRMRAQCFRWRHTADPLFGYRPLFGCLFLFLHPIAFPRLGEEGVLKAPADTDALPFAARI